MAPCAKYEQAFYMAMGPHGNWKLHYHATREQLVYTIASHVDNTSAGEARNMINHVLHAVAFHLAKGESLELRGLGSFRLRLSKPRPGRNPKHPEQRVRIPARWTVKFRPGKAVRDALDSFPTG